MMNLPPDLKIERETSANKTRYLRVADEARAKAAMLDWPAKGLRVGLVWSGNPKSAREHFRSVRPDELGPLLGVQGVHFFSLQTGTAREQLKELKVNGSVARVKDLTPRIRVIADTAAVMEQLDLMITVDTAMAHLAGALNRPVWVMIPAVPDWRWMIRRTDAPCYRTMRLYRQEKLGAWAAVVEQMRRSLQASAQRAEKLPGATR